MIQEFSYINGEGLKIELKNIEKIDGSLVEEYKKTYFKIYNSDTLGVSWKFNNDYINIIQKDVRIMGVLSIDKNYVVSIHYYKTNNQYTCNQYLIIYNIDGSIHKKVFVPQLISKVANEHYRKIKYPQTISFSNLYWREMKDGKRYFIVKIGFGWDWYEERIFDPKTGEFGECVGSGRF